MLVLFYFILYFSSFQTQMDSKSLFSISTLYKHNLFAFSLLYSTEINQALERIVYMLQNFDLNIRSIVTV